MDHNYKYSLDNLTEKAMAPHSSTLAWKIPWMEDKNCSIVISVTSLSARNYLETTTTKVKNVQNGEMPGAGERHSTRDKGHEEGGWAYTKAGSTIFYTS